MKAAILENKGVITYQDVPQPTPSPDHVLLEVKAASICGSDISRFAKGHRMYPLILGHEVAGVIAAVGEGVSDELVGKHAAIIPLVPCFRLRGMRARLLFRLPQLLVHRVAPGGRFRRFRRNSGAQCPDDPGRSALRSRGADRAIDGRAPHPRSGRVQGGTKRGCARRGVDWADGGAVAAHPRRVADHLHRRDRREPRHRAEVGRSRHPQSAAGRRGGGSQAAERRRRRSGGRSGGCAASAGADDSGHAPARIGGVGRQPAAGCQPADDVHRET